MNTTTSIGNVFTIRKTFKFECAHRLVSSWSKKCQQIHGHSYKLELFLQSNELNEDGMVIDFGQIKQLFQDNLEQFDHKIVIWRNDPHIMLEEGWNKKEIEDEIEQLGFIVVDFNPTAENMAKYFYELLENEFYANEEIRHIRIKAVRIHETETGWAEYGSAN